MFPIQQTGNFPKRTVVIHVHVLCSMASTRWLNIFVRICNHVHLSTKSDPNNMGKFVKLKCSPMLAECEGTKAYSGWETICGPRDPLKGKKTVLFLYQKMGNLWDLEENNQENNEESFSKHLEIEFSRKALCPTESSFNFFGIYADTSGTNWFANPERTIGNQTVQHLEGQDTSVAWKYKPSDTCIACEAILGKCFVDHQ